MSRHVVTMIGLLSAAALCCCAGCAEKKTVAAAPDQSAQMRDRIRELERELAKAQADRAGCDDQVLALQRERDRLREQLANRPAPAAAPAPEWESVPGGAMTSIEGTVLFDSGKAVLKPGAKQALDRVISVIREKFPNADVYVFGHTDAVPIQKSKWKDNFELSCQRALSVVRALRDDGVGNKMAAAGWGEQLPVRVGRGAIRENRRVEIFAMAPEKALTKSGAPTPPDADRTQ